MIREFKEFAMRGNVVDMAVGIIIGLAFGAIVSSFVADVMMPVIGLGVGGIDFSNRFVVLKEGAAAAVPYASVAAAKAAGATTLNYGLFINTIVNFLIVAFALFLVVKAMNATRRPLPVAAPVATNEEVLLTQIRDLLARR
jgi:large conductance mechanosensitive channel